MDNYLTIPGFPRYRIIRETKEVHSLGRDGRWKTIRAHRCGCYRLLDDDKREYAAKPDRLLYAAQRGIDPSKMGRDLFVVERGGELCLLDRRALAVRTNKSKPKKSEDTIREEYRQAIYVAQTILAAYDTGDYAHVVAEIWKYESRARQYMRAHKMALNEEKQDELWMQAFDVTIDAIKNRRAYVVNLWGYLTRVLRTLHANIIKANSMIRSLDERRIRIKS